MNDYEKKRYIEEIFKYCRTDSLWIINENNNIEELHCPFPVIATRDVGELKKDSVCIVREIKMSFNLLDVYIIRNRAYYYYNFELLE